MRILYVCTGNSFRSPIAEALTRRYKPGLEVESAGTRATDHIADVARELLEQEDTLEFVKPSPDQLSQRAVGEADKIVAMMSGHRDYILDNFETGDTEVEVWKIKDPIKPEVDAEDAFEQIKKNVREL